MQGAHVLIVEHVGRNIVVAGLARAVFPARGAVVLCPFKYPVIGVRRGQQQIAEAIAIDVRKAVPGELVDIVGIDATTFRGERFQASGDEHRRREARDLELLQNVFKAVASECKKDEIGILAFQIVNHRRDGSRVDLVVGQRQAMVGCNRAGAQKLLQGIPKAVARDVVLQADERDTLEFHFLDELGNDRHSFLVLGWPRREHGRIGGDEIAHRDVRNKGNVGCLQVFAIGAERSLGACGVGKAYHRNCLRVRNRGSKVRGCGRRVALVVEDIDDELSSGDPARPIDEFLRKSRNALDRRNDTAVVAVVALRCEEDWNHDGWAAGRLPHHRSPARLPERWGLPRLQAK